MPGAEATSTVGRPWREAAVRYARTLYRFRFSILVMTLLAPTVAGTDGWGLALRIALALLVWVPMAFVWGSAINRSVHEFRGGLRD